MSEIAPDTKFGPPKNPAIGAGNLPVSALSVLAAPAPNTASATAGAI